jgi:hypothetical protein
MSSVVISGDTSGAITLAAPAVSGTNTATLPAATGTVMVSGNMPAFYAYQSSTQTPSSGTWTKIQYQTEVFDTNNCFDSTTNYRFTPTVAGYYQLSGGVLYTTATILYLQLYKNGSGWAWWNMSETSTIRGGYGSSLVYFNGTTDYVELYAYLTVGSATSANQTQTWFTGAMVRAA